MKPKSGNFTEILHKIVSFAKYCAKNHYFVLHVDCRALFLCSNFAY